MCDKDLTYKNFMNVNEAICQLTEMVKELEDRIDELEPKPKERCLDKTEDLIRDIAEEITELRDIQSGLEDDARC